MRRLIVPLALAVAAFAAPPAHAVLDGPLIHAAFNTGFTPADTGAKGQPIYFTNDDASIDHTATDLDGRFDLPLAHNNGGASLGNTTLSGRYEFVCKFHPSMKGVLSIAPDASAEATDFPRLDPESGIAPRTKATYTLGGAATTIAPTATLTQPDQAADQIASVTVAITTGYADGDALTLTPVNNVSAHPGPAGEHSIVLDSTTVDDDETVFEAALRAVKFSTTSTTTGTRRITFVATDSGANQGISPTEFRDIEVKAAPSSGGTNPGGGNQNPGGGGTQTPPGQQPQGPGAGDRPNPTGDGQPAGAPPVTKLKGTLVVDAKGRVTIVFTTTPNATGTVQLLLPAVQRASAAAARRLASGAFRANAQGRVSVKVRIGAAARKAIKRRAKHRRTKATLVVKTAGGTTTKAVVLKM